MHNKYLMFKMWTEYHARKQGYLFLRRFFEEHESLGDKQTQIQNIIYKEWPKHKQIHYDEYHSADNYYSQMYSTMQLLGRYSAWCDLFPDVFNLKSLKKDFHNSAPWICNLFDFLRNHEELDDIIICFDELEQIFKEN